MFFPSRRSVSGLALAATLTGASQAEAVFCPEEQSRARAIAGKISDEWPQRPAGEEVSRYIQKLGERLGRAASPEAGVAWRFTTLRDHAPFAFAIGYGFIYVTDGALRFSRTESELAAILAHEIGHQLAGHFCRSFESSGGSIARKERGQSSIGSLHQVIDLRKEQDADRLAVGILRAAGFDPHAMYTVAERLPQSAAYGHAQGDNRRLSALRAVLGGKREGSRPAELPRAEDFERAKAVLGRER